MKGASLPLGRLVAGTAASRGAEAAPPRSPQPHHRPCRMSCGKDVVLPAAGGEGRAGETVQARGKQKLHQKKRQGREMQEQEDGGAGLAELKGTWQQKLNL